MRRRRLRVWHVWLVSVGASFLVQCGAERPPDPAPDRRVVDLTAQGASGPRASRKVRVVFDDVGRGPAVIYLHGSPGSGRDARHLAAMLADEFRVLAPDLPGFGQSSRRVPDYGIDAHARYVLELMDREGIAQAHFVGHSMGSGVAYLVADRAPGRVLSITSYGGIGIQRGEGSGDYHLEHLKYAVGWCLLVALPELVPHFGLMGPRDSRRAFVRNFWDTDQRPLEGVLERLRAPLLILHGRHDPLVAAWVAEEHHRIVRHSRLVMLDASHFLVFSRNGSRHLASWIRPFLARHRAGDAAPLRRTLDLSDGPGERAWLTRNLGGRLETGPWGQLARLASAASLLPGATCGVAGVLAQDLKVDPFVGFLGGLAGTVVGDGLLFAAGGRIGRRRTARWIARLTGWLERRPRSAVVVGRLVPGARVLLYAGLGTLRNGKGRGIALRWLAASAPVAVGFWLVLGMALGSRL